MKNWEQILSRAVARRWTCYRKALKHCQRDFSESSIHASRIEARRLAAELDLLRVFAPRLALEKAHRSLKRHLDTFDPLRDAQVQIAILRKEGDGIAGTGKIRKLIAKRECRCRREARRRIRGIKTRRIKKVVSLLIEQLQEKGKNPERIRLNRINIISSVDTAFTHVAECRRHVDAAHTATIHRLRVAFKKFRYMMESMRRLLPGITPRRLAAMKTFQTTLGDLQDTEIFLARIDRFVAKERVKASEVAAFRRWLLRRRVRQIKHCLRRADAVFQFWPPASLETK